MGRAGLQGIARHPGSTAFMARPDNRRQNVGFILGRSIAPTKPKSYTRVCARTGSGIGIGRKPGRGARRAVKKAEARRLYPGGRAGNASALRPLPSAGLPGVGRRKGYYRAPRQPPEDAFDLALDLYVQPLGGGDRQAAHL